ncbi:beta-lactamase/transpeptidase-like protein [Chytridium lagenaria]|nr:beta-lactamase/transpeptidase-like protein [Chytridium lagenaria]
MWTGKTRVPMTCNLVNVGCPSWPVGGTVSEGFEEVLRAFKRNFDEGTEVGAGFAAYVGEEKVVDLYGGYTDHQLSKPYSSDTLQTVFSSSKVVEGLVTAYLVDKKLLSYEDKISTLWPEFAQGNKENVSVKDLLGHRAGVTYLTRGPTLEEIGDLDRLARMLAAQPHNFEGKSIQGYAGITRGWYLNEIVRRVHPEGRTIGQILRHEIMPLLGVEFYIGLPVDLEHRISHLISPPALPSLVKILTPNLLQRNPPSPVVRAVINPLTITHRALRSSAPRVLAPWPLSHNRREMWANEGPSFSGMSNAKSLAKMAALLANRGRFGDAVIFSEETARRALMPLDEQMDVVVRRKLTFTVGGWGYRVRFPCCPDMEWIGWGGVGGRWCIGTWSTALRLATCQTPWGKCSLHYSRA